jgi:GTPase SAR1 family protein
MTDQSGHSSSSVSTQKPTILIVMGMAGSGKTTFVRRVYSYLSELKIPVYGVNLDPAVHQVPFPANIDIRNTIDYKDVMKR